MPSCDKCSSVLPDNGEFVICTGCDSKLHFDCSGFRSSTWIGMSSKTKKEWRCISCRANSKVKLQPPTNLKHVDNLDTDSNATAVLLSLKDEISCLSKQVQALQTSVNVSTDRSQKEQKGLHLVYLILPEQQQQRH